jgi:hypothetical protein
MSEEYDDKYVADSTTDGRSILEEDVIVKTLIALNIRTDGEFRLQRLANSDVIAVLSNLFYEIKDKSDQNNFNWGMSRKILRKLRGEFKDEFKIYFLGIASNSFFNIPIRLNENYGNTVVLVNDEAIGWKKYDNGEYSITINAPELIGKVVL